jgi:hypothetical protein
VNNVLAIAIASLSTFRLAYMLCHESGPFNVLGKARTLPFLRDLFSCFYCTSVWVGIGHALALSTWLGVNGIGQTLVTGLALSTIAIFVCLVKDKVS